MTDKRSTVETILDEIDKALSDNGDYRIPERYADLERDIDETLADCESYIDYIDMVSGTRFDSERGRLTVTHNAELIA